MTSLTPCLFFIAFLPLLSLYRMTGIPLFLLHLHRIFGSEVSTFSKGERVISRILAEPRCTCVSQGLAAMTKQGNNGTRTGPAQGRAAGFFVGGFMRDQIWRAYDSLCEAQTRRQSIKYELERRTRIFDLFLSSVSNRFQAQ
ncbi:hypothetical protein C8R42DRAFT_440762 [Lentinula raphanica]|nr:hypothetical protein C8R42DRAFT_440762 [Lentinula raphanica]